MTDKKTTAKKKETIRESLFRFHGLFEGAEKTGVNDFFKKDGKGSSHFTLDGIIRATTPILQECGLFVSHYVEQNCLRTVIYNLDDEIITSSIPLPETDNPQVTGSCLTYFKRYNLTNLLNISEADDDANFASLGVGKPPSKEKLEKVRQARPPQDFATEKQLFDLNAFLKKFQENPEAVREVKQLESYLAEPLTKNDADDILIKLKENYGA